MKRIGVAASKMAKDNYWLYHFYVVLIASLLSLLLFLVVGLVVVFALAILSYVGTELLDYNFNDKRNAVIIVCMASLTIVTLLVNIFAISINLRLPDKSDKK